MTDQGRGCIEVQEVIIGQNFALKDFCFVQTFLIRSKPTGETLAHFTVITGVAMEDDMRAEVDLLRAELDMLKRAFRRHCVETAG